MWYLSTVILPIAFLVISWPVVWYKMLFTGAAAAPPGAVAAAPPHPRPGADHIDADMRAFPKYKFAIMALFDALFNLMSTFPIYHLGSNLSNVLSQSVLPVGPAGAGCGVRTWSCAGPLLCPPLHVLTL